jgi:hypothetical protein
LHGFADFDDRFDALLNGDYSFIENDIPNEWKGRKIIQFKPKRPRIATDEQIKERLEGFAGDFTFDISSGWCNKYTGVTKSPSQSFSQGVTISEPGNIIINIAFERLLPFLDARLTGPERQVDVCDTATMILHETCVR